MKKIIIILLCALGIALGYHAMNIWNLLDTSSSSIGRLEITDRNGTLIALLPKGGGYRRSYADDLDNPLTQAILSTEDRRFYEHHGVDIVGKIGALRANYQAGSIVRGGSTLTEQYIKNQYFPKKPRTLIQKGEESLWALIMELKYSKEEILRKYLDTVYMGNGLYGIQSALDVYFGGKKTYELSDNDIIEIVTRIKYPNLGNGSEAYTKDVARKIGGDLLDAPFEKREGMGYTNTFPFLTTRIQAEIEKYCQAKEHTLTNFLKVVPPDICTKDDLSLISSIDADISLSLEALLEGVISPLESKNVHNGSILIWSEKEKKILAYIGNRKKGRENAVDMITRKRSVGSTLKPFVYLQSLRGGSDPDSLILDDTVIYETAYDGRVFVPENYIPKSYGPITLREALGNSLNSATVRLSESIGIGRIYENFRSLGLDLDHDAGYYGYGISLGTVELSLENLMTGYRTLMDLDDPNQFLLFDMLSDSSNRAKTFGISSILNTSIPLAVKTGTSTDFRDNWTIGYDEDILIGVWVGNTNNESMNDVSGISGAGPLFHSAAELLISGGYIVQKERHIPFGIKKDSLCLDTKCLQKTLTYSREGWSRKSRPLSKIYFEEDFITPLTGEEKKKWKIQ